jgi:hypothetical protein
VSRNGPDRVAAIAYCNLHISNHFESAIFLTLLKTRTYTHVVTRQVSIAALLLVAAALLSPAAAHAQAVPRSMYVSALDESGAPVADLGPSDFLVREDKAPARSCASELAARPAWPGRSGDNNRRRGTTSDDIRNGLDGFVAEMTNGGKNELSITALAERPTALSPPSTDREQIMKGVFRIFEQRQSGSYLLDALIEVSKGYAKREAQRPVIVVITTEGPEFSSRRYEDVLKPLHEVGAALHVLVLGPPSNSIDEDAQHSAVLDKGPRPAATAMPVVPRARAENATS